MKKALLTTLLCTSIVAGSTTPLFAASNNPSSAQTTKYNGACQNMLQSYTAADTLGATAITGRFGACGNRLHNASFIDENNNGICDNKEQNNPQGSAGQGSNFIDENNDGVCDRQGSNSRGNFVDENNDGICDNKTNTNQNAPGRGQQHRRNQ